LAEQWLEATTIPIEQLIGKGKSQILFSEVSIGEAARYSCEDAVLPIKLKGLMEAVLTERNQMNLFLDIELPLIPVLAEMEWQGVCIDTRLLQELSVDYTARLAAISSELFRFAGSEFNVNSPKQVSEVLFTRLGLPHSKKRKTGMATDVDTLEKLSGAHPIVPKLLEYRELQKLLSTYIDAFAEQILPKTGRLHTSFNQTVAATGRLSSTNPNLQNIPIRTDAGRRIREAFIAPPQYNIVAADYSQIELRLLAHTSKDALLIQAFLDDRDIHTQTASAIYGVFPEMVTPEMRRNAKAINFGLIYGMGPINLSRQIGVSFSAAQEFIDTYFRQFPSIEAYMSGNIDKARKNGYAETLMGRRRYLPEISADNRQIREGAERIALNMPLQGSAADIIKLAMVKIHAELPVNYPDVAMLLQVHDELVFQVPETQTANFMPWVTAMMSTAFLLDVPLKVDVGMGKNWSLAH
jgi:DNA polymerase-1